MIGLFEKFYKNFCQLIHFWKNTIFMYISYKSIDRVYTFSMFLLQIPNLKLYLMAVYKKCLHHSISMYLFETVNFSLKKARSLLRIVIKATTNMMFPSVNSFCGGNRQMQIVNVLTCLVIYRCYKMIKSVIHWLIRQKTWVCKRTVLKKIHLQFLKISWVFHYVLKILTKAKVLRIKLLEVAYYFIFVFKNGK